MSPKLRSGFPEAYALSGGGDVGTRYKKQTNQGTKEVSPLVRGAPVKIKRGDGMGQQVPLGICFFSPSLPVASAACFFSGPSMLAL